MMRRFFSRIGPMVPGCFNSMSLLGRGVRYVRHEDVTFHDAARRTAERGAADRVLAVDAFDACERLDHAGGMADPNLLVVPRVGPRGLMNDGPWNAARDPGADGARARVRL